MKDLTPKPLKTGYLPQNKGHKIYFAEYGNPEGTAIISLHGGPGGKSKLQYINSYNLEEYRVVLFDQRGCGQSQPAGEIHHNTTQNLIEDIERLRNFLKIKRWFVVGGSWGTTLALAYAEEYPEKVSGLLLCSIFLARPQDIQWVYDNNGVRRLFPDLWENDLTFLNKFNERPDKIAKTLLEKIEQGSPKVKKEIAAEVKNWEGNLMSAQRNLKFVNPEDITSEDIAAAKISLHYLANNYFLKPNQILDNITKIKSIPTVIVHGRYDILCPLEQTWEIKKALKNTTLTILPTSNHQLTADGKTTKNLAFNSFLNKCQKIEN